MMLRVNVRVRVRVRASWELKVKGRVTCKYP